MSWKYINEETYPSDLSTLSVDDVARGIRLGQADAQRGRDELARRGYTEAEVTELSASRMKCHEILSQGDPEDEASNFYCGKPSGHDGAHGEWYRWDLRLA